MGRGRYYVVTLTYALMLILLASTVHAMVIPEVKPLGEPVSIDEVASAVVEPQNVTVGDSEIVNMTLEINISEANTLSPVADLEWSIVFLEPEYFNVQKTSVEAYYIDVNGVRHDIDVTVSIEDSNVYVDFYIGSVDSENITIYVVASTPTTTKLTSLGTTVTYGLGGGIGDTIVQQMGFANTTVYIVHKPPKVSVDVEPKLLGKGVGAPGTIFNISLNVYDASGVYNVSVNIYNESNSLVSQWFFGSDVTGNSTLFSYVISWNTTGLPEGNYTVEVKSYDVLGIEPSIKHVSIELRKGFIIPKDFTKVSEALAYPGLTPGSIIYVESNVTETSTLNIGIPISLVGVGNVFITFQNVDLGFNISSPCSIANLGIKGVETVFKLVNVKGTVTIENVNAIASRFLRIQAPYTIDYWNHTISDSTLNGSRIAYLVGNNTLVGEFIEAYLVFGYFNVSNASISTLSVINSTVSMVNSSILVLEAVGSSMEGINTEVKSWYGVESTYLGYSQVWVRVLFNDKPVKDAYVVLTTELAETYAYTDSEGYAELYGLVTNCTNGVCVTNYTAVIKASKKGLSTSTIVDLSKPPIHVILSLPVPHLSVTVKDIFGRTITELTPGIVLNVSSTYDLLTYVGKAYIEVVLYKNDKPIITSRTPVSDSGTVVVGVMIPYEDGAYTIKVYLKLEELPSIVVTWP